jgi:hypothetical protein
VLERGGQTLIIENKTVGVSVNTGQRIVLEAFVAQGSTVLIQETQPPNEDEVVSFTVWKPDGTRESGAGRLERDEWLAEWWRRAEANHRDAHLRKAA